MTVKLRQVFHINGQRDGSTVLAVTHKPTNDFFGKRLMAEIFPRRPIHFSQNPSERGSCPCGGPCACKIVDVFSRTVPTDVKNCALPTARLQEEVLCIIRCGNISIKYTKLRCWGSWWLRKEVRGQIQRCSLSRISVRGRASMGAVCWPCSMSQQSHCSEYIYPFLWIIRKV